MYKFYIQMDSSIFGPYTTKEIIDLDIPDDTLVRESSIVEWEEAQCYDFQELFNNEKQNDTTVPHGFVINSNGAIKRHSSPTNIETQTILNYERPVNHTSPNKTLPVEIKKWNWGAFFFSWLWATCYNIYWPLAMLGLAIIALFVTDLSLFSGITSLVISILLGINGSEWAWKAKTKRWESVEQFKKAQANWAKAIIYVLIGSIVLGIILSVLILLAQ